MDNLQLTAMIIDIILFAIFLALFSYSFYLAFASEYSDYKLNKQDKLDNDLYEHSAE
jgi:hypothetical protein